MRALIDYRPALRARTGAGEYIHELARALARSAIPRGWSIAVFTSSWKDRPAPRAAADLGAVTLVDRRIPGALLNLLWHRLEWPPIERVAGARFDVVHAAHPLLIPSRDAAQIVTIHDLDFLHHPERTRAEIRRDYAALAAAHAVRADRIITSSAFSAGEIERELGVPRGKISVCPAGAPEWPDHPDDRAAAVDPVPLEPCILFLGTLEPRKNIGTLLDAYERMLSRNPAPPHLVIAGGSTPAAQAWIDRAARPPLRGHVLFPGYVPDAVKRTWYERAAMFVLPSHHEGFGMTVLEAMSVGVPVIASNRGSLPEVLGDAGVLVDADDAAGLAAAMTRMLDDESLRAACRIRGRDRARQFTWRASAERVIEAYELAVEEKAQRKAAKHAKAR